MTDEQESEDLLATAASLQHYTLVNNILDNLGVAVIVVYQDGKIVIVNKEAEYLFGYSRQELKGESVEILVPDYAKEKHQEYRRDYVAEPRTRAMGHGLDLKAVKKNGDEIPVSISLGSFMGGNGVYITATIIPRKA